jgi:hypothetical protein
MIERPQDRIDQTGEVFTPIPLVNEILDKLPADVWKKNKTFLDNSCGDGNFLVCVVAYKIEIGRASAYEALSTTFGVDLMYDNVQHARQRVVAMALKLKPHARKKDCEQIAEANIVCHDALTYHYNFDGTHDAKFDGHHRPGKCPDCAHNLLTM